MSCYAQIKNPNRFQACAGFALLFWVASAHAESKPAASKPPSTQIDVGSFCGEVDSLAGSLKWKLEPCLVNKWKAEVKSVKGRPLVYAEFGDPKSPNKTLILSTVHGDEVTPTFLGLRLAQWLRENPTASKVHVILAPIVNPDSLLSSPRTRVNSRGVDLNRNFSTQDWNSNAVKAWKTRFRSDKRRFPGASPASEPETAFQQELIHRFKPQKILSIHAPLNFMDYDGPTTLALAKFPREYVDHCLKLRNRLRAVSGGYYPGSLGNYAGQELGIPTLTLELPSADGRKALEYWTKFSEGIRTMIEFEVPGHGRADGQTSSGG